MLEIQNLSKSFGRKKVIRDVSVCFPSGKIALLGPNGAGKTTLLRLLLELYRCESGEILWEGKTVTNKGILPSHAGYLPQSFGVYPRLTCSEMLEYFAVLKKIPKKQRKDEVRRCLELVNLSDRAGTLCAKLSGGMVRRLGIAQALLGDPQFILFDEPTAGLDPEERLRFKLLVHSMAATRTIIISTHIVDDVDALCDRVVVMHEGCVIANSLSKEMALRASGLVWQVPKEQEKELPEDAYIRAIRVLPEGDMLIVLSEVPVGTPIPPTIEDGYLCYLKGIGG